MAGLFRRYGFAAAIAAGLALMTLVVAGKTLFASVEQAASSTPRGGPGGGGPQAPPVVAVPVAMHTFTDGLQAIGTAQARESIVLTPKVADTIRVLRFESGDRIRRGQVLVEMSSVEQAADLAEARAANDAAQQELRRYQELFDRGFASQARLDTVRAAADAAEARLNAGSSRIADRTIRAPFAGVVGLRTASPGQYVRPGEQIGTLDDISEIKLDFDVPETRLARLSQGVSISARTGAYPERVFEGVVAHVDSRVDPTTRTVRVRAILANADEAIRPGMLMTVEVRSNPREALAVPEVAILEQATSSRVYRVVTHEGAQSVEIVQIETGQRVGGMAEVLAGLSEGDQVIVEGMQNVRPGLPVQLTRPAESEGAAEIPLRPRG
jgi:membrane fusion protein, multidrug efflux system